MCFQVKSVLSTRNLTCTVYTSIYADIICCVYGDIHTTVIVLCRIYLSLVIRGLYTLNIQMARANIVI